MKTKHLGTTLKYLWPLAGVVATILVFKFAFQGVSNVTVALSFVVVVVFCASFLDLGPSLLASVIGALSFNFFFIPPVGTFVIDDPQDILSFCVLAGTGLIVSRLSATIKLQAQEAVRRSGEVEKLYRLGKLLIETPDTLAGAVSIADKIVTVFGVDYCGIHIPNDKGVWKLVSLSSEYPPEARLPRSKNMRQSTMEELSNEMSRGGIRYSVLRTSKRVIGIIALKAGPIAQDTGEAIASLVALTLERNRAIRAH